MTIALPEGDLRYLTDEDRQRLLAILNALPLPARELLWRSMQAIAAFDARPLPALLPLLSPTLRALPPENCTALLDRIAQLAQVFPAGLVPLFRALGRVYEGVGGERTLEWISTGEAIGSRNPLAGEAFFTLKSRTSLLQLHGESQAVYLSDIQGVLLKYLHMLSGTAIGLSETKTLSFPPPLAEGQGEIVPLPLCIEHFPTYEENFRFYCVLVAHQAGRVEFGTYTCSPSRLWPLVLPFLRPFLDAEIFPPDDLPAYFTLFPRPDLIEALFLGIEGKRIATQLAARYPGLQADLAWADSLTDLAPPESTALLSQLPETTWSELGRTGTVSDSLFLATQLYSRFLQYEPGLTAEDSAAQQGDGITDRAGDAMAFLTGVDLGRRGEESALSPDEQAARRRRALTTMDLRYVYDEWDYEIEDYRPRWCELREIPLQGDEGALFSRTLVTYADLVAEIKSEFQRLRPRMFRQVKGLEDGEDIDLNAAVAARVDLTTGVSPSAKLYMAREPIERDVAVLFLVDLSASTAARVPEDAAIPTPPAEPKGPRVIDLLKEALVLLSVALEEIGDVYAIYGFSSRGRYDVSVYPVKTFREVLSIEVQGRIGAITPQGSTRMGTAIRHAARRLKALSQRVKLLILLSDGYPEDEGYGKPVAPPTYALRDTMMALREAERSGILSFCLTIDKGGHDYLKEICAPSRYLVIDDILSLPTELPKIYRRYIWSQGT
jgi:nitric oxide reductase NorD protein